MPEQKREVKTFVVDMRCDQCEKGNMHPTGEVKTSYPPLYVHICNVCGYNKLYTQHYPRVEYEDVN